MASERTQITFQGENGRDEFQREQIADKVISLLTSDIDISPMVIDGHWGTGKTEFCHKLINKLAVEHKDYRPIYIDAFKADHADSPLLTILAEVLNLLPEYPPTPNTN
jgi:predicted KAP-like P-loop ATPase